MLLCFRWWKAFFNLMGFICILLVYFWGKTICTLFSLQSCLYYSFPYLRWWVQDLIFFFALGTFLLLGAIYLLWQPIYLSCPTQYSASSNSPYFLFCVICLVFPDLFQLCGWSVAPPLRGLMDGNLVDGVESISLITSSNLILSFNSLMDLYFSGLCFYFIKKI